jgi:hypothetical protein
MISELDPVILPLANAVCTASQQLPTRYIYNTYFARLVAAPPPGPQRLTNIHPGVGGGEIIMDRGFAGRVGRAG